MKRQYLLIVDDDPTILQLTASLFKREGIEVYCAANGEEALLLLKEKVFHMLITDLNMPGMLGFELAGIVRERFPAIYICMMSGDVSVETLKRARMAGIENVFEKPLNLSQLVETTRKVFDAGNEMRCVERQCPDT